MAGGEGGGMAPQPALNLSRPGQIRNRIQQPSYVSLTGTPSFRLECGGISQSTSRPSGSSTMPRYRNPGASHYALVGPCDRWRYFHFPSPTISLRHPRQLQPQCCNDHTLYLCGNTSTQSLIDFAELQAASRLWKDVIWGSIGKLAQE